MEFLRSEEELTSVQVRRMCLQWLVPFCSSHNIWLLRSWMWFGFVETSAWLLAVSCNILTPKYWEQMVFFSDWSELPERQAAWTRGWLGLRVQRRLEISPGFRSLVRKEKKRKEKWSFGKIQRHKEEIKRSDEGEWQRQWVRSEWNVTKWWKDKDELDQTKTNIKMSSTSGIRGIRQVDSDPSGINWNGKQAK